MAILIHGGTHDNGMDRIAICERIGEPLHQDHTRSFTPHESVGRSIKGLAFAFRRQHPGLGKSDKSIRRNHHSHATSHRRLASTRQDVLAGHVNRGEGGRTGRIQGDAGATQVEAIGNAVGCNAVSATRRGVGANAGAVCGRVLDGLIIIVRNSDEDAHISALLEIQYEPGILNRLPSRLKEEPLLRVDVGRLARRDPEKLRIKLINRAQKTASLGDRLSNDSRLSIVKPLHVPAIGRHIANALPAFHKQIPKRFRIIHSSRKPAADSDDGNALPLAWLRGEGSGGIGINAHVFYGTNGTCLRLKRAFLSQSQEFYRTRMGTLRGTPPPRKQPMRLLSSGGKIPQSRQRSDRFPSD